MISSSQTIAPDRELLPSLPDNVWLIILQYVARDNARNLLELSTNIADHPIGRIAQDHRYQT